MRVFAVSNGFYRGTVQEWEWAAMPNDINMDKLAEVMAITPEEMRTAWKEWMKSMPLPAAPTATRILHDSIAS